MQSRYIDNRYTIFIRKTQKRVNAWKKTGEINNSWVSRYIELENVNVTIFFLSSPEIVIQLNKW